MADMISRQVTQIETDLKTKASAYNNLKGSLQAMERKQTLVNQTNLLLLIYLSIIE
jgi:hypothetical protein